MKYIIQFKGGVEVEAESPEKAKAVALDTFKKLEELKVSVEEAKVADKNSGYFLN